MKELMYVAGLAYSDVLLATRNESSIEAMVCDYLIRPPEFRIAAAELQTAVQVLQRIDQLEVERRYEAERAALRAKVVETDAVKEIDAAMNQLRGHLENRSVQKLLDDTQNFLAGLKSPDLAQRARFECAAEHGQLMEKTPGEIAPFLAIIERAKGRKGRPAVNPPWLHETTQMSEIRLKVSSGLSIPVAARETADREGRANASSRAKYFERLFRQKQSLREVKSTAF